MIFKKYYKTLSVFLLIIVLCFLPGNTANKLTFFDFPHFDKLVHFGMYFIFSFALFLDLKTNTRIQKKQILLIILLLTLFIGGGIEIIQNYFIPQRFGDWFDLLADFFGSLVFIAGFFVNKNSFKVKIFNKNDKE